VCVCKFQKQIPAAHRSPRGDWRSNGGAGVGYGGGQGQGFEGDRLSIEAITEDFDVCEERARALVDKHFRILGIMATVYTFLMFVQVYVGVRATRLLYLEGKGNSKSAD